MKNLTAATWAEVLRKAAELELSGSGSEYHVEGIKAWEYLAKDLRTYFVKEIRKDPPTYSGLRAAYST